MKNYGDLRGCYPPRPTASTDNSLLDLNSSYDTQPRSLTVKYLQHKSCDHFEHLRQSAQVTTVPHPLTVTHVVSIQYLPKSWQDGRASDPRGSKNISSRVSRSLLQRARALQVTGEESTLWKNLWEEVQLYVLIVHLRCVYEFFCDLDNKICNKQRSKGFRSYRFNYV